MLPVLKERKQAFDKLLGPRVPFNYLRKHVIERYYIVRSNSGALIQMRAGRRVLASLAESFEQSEQVDIFIFALTL